ncbi:hypothetical protein ACKGJI_06090 [Sulfurospirillum sp. 1307]|jgi:valyl-tRNA synthetase
MMLDQLFPVIFVVAVVAFILIKQIKHIASQADNRVSVKNNFEKYSKFSVEIQNFIREIKADIDSSKNKENPKYILVDKTKEEEYVELLSDFLRKLVFFETLLAKNKAPDEIESELFEVLSKVDDFLRNNVVDGEKLADELRDELHKIYQNL